MRLSGLQRKEERLFYVFISPWLIGFLAFYLIPILASLGLSLTEYNFFRPPQFVGLANYARLLTGELFRVSLFNTLYMVVFGVPVWVAAALGIALLVNKEIRGIRVFRTGFYLPAVTSGVAVSVLWMYIFLPQFGLIPQLLSLVGLRSPFWLGDPRWVKPAFIIMGTWAAGGSMPIYLAGLKGIPKELYEVAELDGAGVVTKFRHITLPLLTPVLFFNLVTGVIGSFQYFTQAYVMTAGGPVNATLFLGLYIYREAFEALRMGSACALACVLFFFTIAATAVQFWGARRWVYYEF